MQFKHYWMLIQMLKLLLFLFRKDVKDMAVVYATLIVKGKKKITDVPITIKEQVKQVLIDLDCSDLAVE